MLTSSVVIKYTKHAVNKFKNLPPGSITVTKKNVLKAIKNPDFKDLESDKPKIIVHGSLDAKHIVRVVYKEENDIITVITFYPSRKGRYEKKYS